MVAYQEPEHYFDVISNYADYMEIMNESAWNVGKANVFSQTMIDLWREKEKTPNGIADSGYPNYVAYPNVDWMEAIFTPSVYQKHSISASGSTERIKYLMSVSYMDNPGVIDNSTVTRTSYRFNLSSDVTEWLEVGARIYGYRSDTELADISGSMTLLSRGVPCIYPYYDGKYGWMENPEQSSESRNNLYFSTVTKVRISRITTIRPPLSMSNCRGTFVTMRRSITPGGMPCRSSIRPWVMPIRSAATRWPTAITT